MALKLVQKSLLEELQDRAVELLIVYIIYVKYHLKISMGQLWEKTLQREL